MVRTLFALLTLTLLAASAVSPEPPRHQGVTWVAGPTTEREQIDRVVELGATRIAKTPFGWQSGPNSPKVDFNPRGGRWGDRDARLEATTQWAREAGLEVLLKPHLWVRGAEYSWSGAVEMESEEDWQTWFQSYGELLLHYARLAEELEIEAFSVGNELGRTTHREADWRQLIAAVREVYSGRLTYAANWGQEALEVPFWDALDWVGVQGYYPLTDTPEPSLEELLAAWRPHRAELAELARRTGKSILFTELGYRSAPGAAARPWEWPAPQGGEEADEALQARLYEAFFLTFWNEPWVAGVYVWKWYPDSSRRDEPMATGFSPQEKKAEQVLAQWFRAALPKDTPDAATD